MIRHICTLIWNQRTRNGWILAELFLVIILLWLVTDAFLMHIYTSRQKLCFDIEGVYNVRLGLRSKDSPSYLSYTEGSTEPVEQFLRIIDQLRRHPDIECVSYSEACMPYKDATRYYMYQTDSISIQANTYIVDPDYFRVFNIRPLTGGTPDQLSHALENNLFIINDRMARELYGTTDVKGRTFQISNDSTPHRIGELCGTIKKYEYESPLPVVFHPRSKTELLTFTERRLSQMDLFFKVRPGVDQREYADRFKQAQRQILSAGNFRLVDVQPMPALRKRFLDHTAEANTFRLRNLVGAFFLVNIFLTVTGTFWLRVKRRRSELGLRMALGSPHAGIRWLMIKEGIALLGFASIPAFIVCLNIAVSGVLNVETVEVTPMRFLSAFGLTWLILAVVICLACWYPSEQSARIQPAEALHYE